MRVIYRVEHLHCPKCAVQIEERLRKLPQIEAVHLEFSCSQLHLTVQDTENLLEQVQNAAREIDEYVCFLDKEHAGHHHIQDYAKEVKKFGCNDPDCHCCDYLPEAEENPSEEVSADSIKLIYDVENIDCANCAAKIEAAIRKIDSIESADLSYATKRLHVNVIAGTQPEELLKEINQVTERIEEGVIYRPHVTAKQESIKLIYDVENIDCANCAAKIEAAIRKIDSIESADLSYATKRLHINAIAGTQPEELIEEIRRVTEQVEEGVIYHLHVTAKQEKPEENHTEVILLIIGSVIFGLGMVIQWTTKNEILSGIFLMAAYLIMGWEVLYAAIKSLCKIQMFDENFLMAIATVGAICIGSWEEAAGVMLFYRIGELFEHIAVERSRKSVMEAIDMRPETVRKIYGFSDVRTIPAEQVQKGDLLLIRAGDRIPVDGVVHKGEGQIDTSAMTGESVPVSVRPGSQVMSGCINLSGVLELEASAGLGDSMITRVLESVENAAAGKPEMDKFITRFSRVYTPVVVIIAILTGLIPPLFNGNWSYWVYTALNFLMVSCPCALVLSVPLAFFSGIGAGSAKGILFKDGISLEALEKIKAVVMDKTGTLTKGTFTVTEAETTDCNTEMLFRLCAACESYSSHPVAKSILAYMQEQGIEYQPAKEVQELSGRGIIGQAEGMRIACGNEKLMQESGIDYPKCESAGTCVYVAVNNAYYGRLVLSDQPKETAEQTIKTLNQRGYYTVMLTGDSSAHTQKVAEELAIQEVHAGLLPTEKPEYLIKVREAKGAVMFIGDGINDAPVLSGADVGVAMGSGADAAMEAADVVLLRSEPEYIVTALDIAKRVNATARICVIFALAVKIVIMLLGFCGFANMWLSVFADTGVTILCILLVLFRIHFYYRKK